MAEEYGLTANGLNIKSLQTIKSELEEKLQGVFGANINLSSESVFGNLVGIWSEREALLWQLAEALYTARKVSGAEGTSVDDMLALTNMRRLSASATRTNTNPITETNGIVKYGLVLIGTAGTVVSAGSIINTNSSPPLSFTLDSNVTIQAAVNAIQNIYQSNAPDSGAFTLEIDSPAGNTLTTPSIPWNALPQITQLKFTGTPTTGAFKLLFEIAGDSQETASIPYTANAAAIESAIQAMTGYSAVTVTGSYAAGFDLDWNGIPEPIVTFSANTMDVTPSVIDSIQSSINTLEDVAAANYPFTDVTVITGTNGYVVSFGAGTIFGSEPSSGAQAQPLFIVAANTLQSGINVTNLKIENQAQGHPSQGIGSATCTQTGPNFVKAGNLNTIGSAVPGWSSVTNQLDCITGSDDENDTQAMIRREENLQSNANGPLQSIVEKVKALPEVTAIRGFENNYDASLQLVEFSGVPVSGSFRLVVTGQPTSLIAYNATSAQVQSAIQALTGFGDVTVAGDFSSGFLIDFNGSYGGQEQPLMQTSSNTLGVTISISYDRPGHSFEIVVEGEDDQVIADEIYKAKPAGILAYGSTVMQVLDNFNNQHDIGFSRPVQVPIYVEVALTTDLGDIVPEFNPQTIADIQQKIVDIGNAVGIGGLIIGFGTNGLIGAFNDIPGIKSYTMYFGRTSNPTQNVNIQLQPEEAPAFETFLVAVSYV